MKNETWHKYKDIIFLIYVIFALTLIAGAMVLDARQACKQAKEETMKITVQHCDAADETASKFIQAFRDFGYVVEEDLSDGEITVFIQQKSNENKKTLTLASE